MQYSFIVILSLLGLICCLQAPLHYTYKYHGSVTTGIPEIGKQRSSWSMKADVEIYVENKDGSTLFQLRNTKVEELIGKECQSDENKKEESLNSDLKVSLEKPFLVSLFNDKVFRISHLDDSEVNWLTNVRKSIALLFKNEILRGNVEGAPFLDMRLFAEEEETIFGKCKVEYAVHTIPKHLSGTRNEDLRTKIVEDIQRGVKRTSLNESDTFTKRFFPMIPKKLKNETDEPKEIFVPELEDELWHVLRSVNFDHCQEMVALQTNIHESERVSKSQSEWRRSRSSVGEYIFRGSPGAMRLEKATIEGATTLAPFGFKSEVLQATVNQTLELISVGPIDRPPIFPPYSRHSKTWMQEVWSPAEVPKHTKIHPWINYTGKGRKFSPLQYYGFHEIPPSDILEIKESIFEYITSSTKFLQDLNQEEQEPQIPGLVMDYLKRVTSLLRLLSKQDILDVMDKISYGETDERNSFKRSLLIDSLVASGSCDAHAVLLDLIKQGKMSETQITFIFMTIASANQCASSFSSFMMSLDDLSFQKTPFLTTTVVLNLAQLAAHTCAASSGLSTHYPGVLFGDEMCNTSTIHQRFVPYLEYIISDEKTTWEKDVAVKALGILGTPFAFPIISSILEGNINCSTDTKAFAIAALKNWKLHTFGGLRKPIMDLLSEIFSNLGMEVSLREIALETFLYWEPEPHFFHLLARASWREPSHQFASFITSSIEAMANDIQPALIIQRQAAFHALKFSKPFLPSRKRSYMLSSYTSLLDKYVMNVRNIKYFSSRDSIGLRKFHFSLLNSLGGFQSFGFELDVIAENVFNVLDYLDDILKEKARGRSVSLSAFKALNLHAKIQEKIKAKPRPESNHGREDIYAKLFNNFHLYLPLNEQTIKYIQLYIFEGFNRKNLSFGKLFAPFEITTFHATEIGLPLLTSISASVVLNNIINANFKLEGILGLGEVELNSILFMRGASSFHSDIKVLIPGSENYIGTEVKSQKEFTIPINLDFEKRAKANGRLSLLRFRFFSLFNQKFSVFRGKNSPEVFRSPAVPTRHKASSSLQILPRDPPTLQNFVVSPEYTGIHLNVSWQSNMEPPWTPWNILDYLMDERKLKGSPWFFYIIGSPTVRNWAVDVELDPVISDTKNVSIEVLDGTYASVTVDLNSKKHRFSLKKQKIKKQKLQGNMNGKHKSHIKFGDSLQNRARKFQKHFGGPVKSTSLKVEFLGSRSKGYEVISSVHSSKTRNLRKVNVHQIAVVKSQLSGKTTKSSSICFDVKKSVPVISPLDKSEDLFSRNVEKRILASLSLGCNQKQAVLAKGFFSVTDDAKRTLQQTSQRECKKESEDNIHTFLSQIIYDNITFAIKWNEVPNYKDYGMVGRALNSIYGILRKGFTENSDYQLSPESSTELKIHLQGSMKDQIWSLDVSGKDPIISVKNIQNIRNLYFLLTFEAKLMNLYSMHSDPESNSDKCHLALNHIRSFDGFSYTFKPSQCWSVAAKDCRHKNGKMLMVRFPQGDSPVLDARYLDIERGLILEFINNILMVNGEQFNFVGIKEIRDKNQELLVIIHKKADSYLIQISENLYVIISDKIEVQVPQYLSGSLCGLCGNYDGEREFELVGPKRCFYSDTQLFTAAWTAGSDICNSYSLAELRKPVHVYQENCTYIDEIRKSYPKLNHRCLHFGWRVLVLNVRLSCASAVPVPFCKRECTTFSFDYNHVEFLCWKRDDAPDEVKLALLSESDFLAAPVVGNYYSKEHLEIATPNLCKH